MRFPPRKLKPFLSATACVALLIGLTGAASAPVQSNDAQNRNVRVHNQTGWTMTHLQVSAGTSWSADLLGSSTLSAGRSTVVRMDDGAGACRYSLRAQFENGQTLQRDGVNACQVADYYFTR